ncbi:predicted protein [Chaetoceros tenuissimus]|uniref:Uncharacterized protein n=1 Tax=Chaetoceros tenuissimus TaxID=426638 RepID=A0AAD3CTP2_9STRA|nr:predicted protein [Chaetoceros tenuissimus]
MKKADIASALALHDASESHHNNNSSTTTTSMDFEFESETQNQDQKALKILQHLFPTRINVQNIIYQKFKKRPTEFLIQETVLKNSSKMIHNIDKKLYMQLMKMLVKFSRDEADSLLELLKTINEKIEHENERKINIFNDDFEYAVVGIPHTIEEARSLMEGDKSFASMLPIPTISVMDDTKHTMVSIKEALTIAIAIGVEFKRMNIFKNIEDAAESSILHSERF